MRKSALVVLLLFVFALGVVGCGKDDKKSESKKSETKKAETKTLSCTMTDEDDESTTTVEYKITYENDKATIVSISMQNKYSSGKYDEEDYKDAAAECKDALKGKGVTCNTSSSGSLVNAYYKFTIADLDDTAKTLYQESGAEELASKSYKDAEKFATKAGLECKEVK